MRILLDASVLIAYLLSPQSRGPAVEVMTRALAGEFVVLAPLELMVEVKEAVIKADYLARRIPLNSLDALIQVSSS